MSNKRTNFELDRALRRIVTPSIFDRIVREVDANEIPIEYIEQIVVHYMDGTVIELGSEEITNPVPLNRAADWNNMSESFKKMKDVKVYVNTEKLESDINVKVEEYLGGKC